MKSNFREDKDGVPLYLDITVINSNTCTELSNAGVEIWHCDASGIYSHYEEASENVQNPQTDDTTYLRGVQLTNETGIASFLSIYPGWYEGRALHIHLKVHQNGTDGAVLHTGQLFFEESLNEMIEEVSPYSSETVTRVLNANDGIYNQGGSYGLITSWSLVGSDISEGVRASINVEVDGPTYYDAGEDEYDNDYDGEYEYEDPNDGEDGENEYEDEYNNDYDGEYEYEDQNEITSYSSYSSYYDAGEDGENEYEVENYYDEYEYQNDITSYSSYSSYSSNYSTFDESTQSSDFSSTSSAVAVSSSLISILFCLFLF